ncbi:hypothetical protein [Trinickia symbiotica]|uniref:hypothetical protein n=1 Tax=Trinickia symbiotica TaxID=863227 RepID=UPI0015E632FD|nr:hypothetical protein [Trinickia symbiotica]
MQVPIVYLQGRVPPDPVIRAQELALYFDAASIVSEARREADALIASAEETLAHATRDAQRIRAQAHEQGLADAQAELEPMRASLVAETVQWCIAESALEAEIAARIDERIGAVIAEALTEFVAEQDDATRLSERVRERLRQSAEHRTMTLRVARETFDATSRECASDENGWRVDVTADPTLTNAQAVIETPFVQIRIDLDTHLQSVLAQLRGTGNEGDHTP